MFISTRWGKGILEWLKKVRYLSHQFVFSFKRNPVKSIKNSLTKALERRGIDVFRFHDYGTPLSATRQRLVSIER